MPISSPSMVTMARGGKLVMRSVRYVLLQDNSGAVADIRKGYSRRMAHLPRHQRVSLGALHERLIEDPEGALEQIASKRQLADLFTKPLGYDAFWSLALQVGCWSALGRPAL